MTKGDRPGDQPVVPTARRGGGAVLAPLIRRVRPALRWWREYGSFAFRTRWSLEGATPPRLPGAIALIPVHRDAATLALCIRSFAPVVEQVVLCLDAPDDPTRALVTELAAEFANVTVVWSTAPDAVEPVGWAATRNRLIAAAGELFRPLTHVLMVDADDVLAWDHVDNVLRPLMRGGRTHVRLGICELLGDWRTTARGRTLVYDECHVYWRASAVDVHFTAQENAHESIHVVDRGSKRDVRAGSSRQILFHGITAKPGDQLLRRAFMRPWIVAGRPEPLDAFAVRMASETFPLPWPEGQMPSDYIIFNDQRRPELRPLAHWERRLPPPVAAVMQAGPRFRMDLAARRRFDRDPMSDLERRTYDALMAASRAGGKTQHGA